jgi:HlyD family secretion protein
MSKTVPPVTDPGTGAAHPGNGFDQTTVPNAVGTDGFAIAGEEELRIEPPRRKRWKVIIPITLVLVLLVAGLYFLLRPTKSALSATVQKGTIISTVETTGKLQSENSTRLAFKNSGRVASVIAKPGDQVKAGDVLAELETNSLQRQLNEATIQLEISKLRLQQAKEGATEADVVAAEANVDTATADLNRVKVGSRPEDVQVAQSALAQAQSQLDQLKRGPSAQDIAIAQSRVDQAKGNRDLVANNAANRTEQARITMQQAASANQNWLDPDGRYEQARLNYEAAQRAEQSEVAIADAQLREAQEGLNRVKAGATPDEIRQAEEGVAIAQANLDKVKRGATQEEINAAQSRVDAAKANLEKVQSGARPSDITILEQQVALSQLSVDNVNAQLADARLISPIDGTVLSIDLDVGETVGGYSPVAVVANTLSLVVKGDVDEIDIGRVTVGQPVTVTLDAYPGVKMPGKIDELAPGATQKQGSTVYQATISFTPGAGVVPREGMAANVDITAQRKDDVLLLPNRAFETVGTREYVTIRDGDTTRKVEVETGLSNSTDTEIISGVTEGQEVVLR